MRKRDRLPSKGTLWLQRRAEEGGQERGKGAAGLSQDAPGRPLKRGPHPGMRGAPATPLRLRSLHWAVGAEGGWGEGSEGVRMPSQLSLGHL